MSIEYEQARLLGSRLHRIGSYELAWEPGLGNVVRAIGSLTLEYGRQWGPVVHWAPTSVVVPGESTTLDEDELMILYFVLCWIQDVLSDDS